MHTETRAPTVNKLSILNVIHAILHVGIYLFILLICDILCGDKTV